MIAPLTAMVVPLDPWKVTIPVRKSTIAVANRRLQIGLGLDPWVPGSDDFLGKHDVLLAEKPGRARPNIVERPNRERIHVEIHATVTVDQRRADQVRTSNRRLQLADEVGKCWPAGLLAKRAIVERDELEIGEIVEVPNVRQLVERIGVM